MNRPIVWAAAIRNLWRMRKLNKARFNEILKEATIYGTPEAKLVKFDGRLVSFNFKGRDLVLRECEVELVEVFFEGIYDKLDVNGKTTIDVGCGAGDTPIYFSLKGARRVIGYDAEESRIRAAEWNLQRNGIKNAEVRCKMVASLAELPFGECLKIDIEGGEHEIFAKAKDEEILRFGQIIMEWHNGHADISERLEKLGYSVNISHETFGGRNGILYAVAR